VAFYFLLLITARKKPVMHKAENRYRICKPIHGTSW
jgi:hypothetical protein